MVREGCFFFTIAKRVYPVNERRIRGVEYFLFDKSTKRFHFQTGHDLYITNERTQQQE